MLRFPVERHGNREGQNQEVAAYHDISHLSHGIRAAIPRFMLEPIELHEVKLSAF